MEIKLGKTGFEFLCNFKLNPCWCLDISLKYLFYMLWIPLIKHQANNLWNIEDSKPFASNNIWKKQTVRDVDGPYLPLQDKSAYFILSPYYGRNQLIPLARNQDPFFSRNPNNMPLNFLPYAKEVFGILVIVHQFHSDKGYWVGSRYQKSLPKCLLICHVETFEVINQEQSPIKGGLFIVSCTNFMSRYGSFGRINCHFNQSDL